MPANKPSLGDTQAGSLAEKAAHWCRLRRTIWIDVSDGRSTDEYLPS